MISKLLHYFTHLWVKHAEGTHPEVPVSWRECKVCKQKQYVVYGQNCQAWVDF